MNSLFKTLYGDFADFFDSPRAEETPEGDHKVVLDVPGFNESNLDIELDDGVLTIKGETPSRKYRRQYYVNSKVHDIVANIVDGELTLTLKYPKTEVKKIPISTDVPQVEITS